MSYTPISVDVYTSAYSGLLAGAAVGGKFLADTNPLSYAHVNKVADAFAQEFDTLYANAAPNSFQLSELVQISEEFWTNRLPAAPPLTIILGREVQPDPYLPATYQPDCLAIIALMAQADTQLASQGIIPAVPIPTGSSGNIGTIVGATDSLLITVPTTAISATVDGYYVAGDGGGGEFYWDTTNVVPVIPGMIVRPTGVLVGAWIRIWSYGILDIRWLGAQPGVDTLVQAALNDSANAAAIALLALQHGGKIRYPVISPTKCIYYISAAVLLQNIDNITLEGDGYWLTAAPPAKYGAWFKVATGVVAMPFVVRYVATHNCQFNNINIDGNLIADIGFGLNAIAASGQTNQHCSVNNVRIEGCTGAPHGYGMSIGELGSGASTSSQQVSNVEILNVTIETCTRAIVVEGGQTTSVTIGGSRGILSGNSYSIDTYAPDLVIRDINFETGGASLADVLIRAGAGIVRMFSGKSETSSGICVQWEAGARVSQTTIVGWTFLYLAVPSPTSMIFDYLQGGNLVCMGNTYRYGNAPHANTTLNNFAGTAPGTPASFTEITCQYENGAQPALTSANGNYVGFNTTGGFSTGSNTGRIALFDGAGQSYGDLLPTTVKIPGAGTYSYMKTGALAQLGVTSASLQLFGDTANAGSTWQSGGNHLFTIAGVTKMSYVSDVFSLPITAVGLAIGADPATAGAIRMGRVTVNGLAIMDLKNNANSGNLRYLAADTGDDLIIGDTNNSSIFYDTYLLGEHDFRHNSVITSFAGPNGFRNKVTNFGFAAGVVNPQFMMDDLATNGGTSTDVIYRGQNATGTTSVGGNNHIQGSTGTATNGYASMRTAAGVVRIKVDDTGIGVFGAAPVAKPTVTGALVDLTATGALKSVLTALANIGWIVDSST